MSDNVLSVSNLSVTFGRGDETVGAVQNVSFTVRRGEALAIVGESGSGKSVTARTILGLTGENSSVEAETLSFDGLNLLELTSRQWREVRGGQIGFVLQDALVSLDPLRTIRREIEEPMRVHFRWTAKQRRAEVVELLRSVGVPDPELRQHQYPHQLSGGLRQRALIASAIAARPAFLILDEPTTALDVTVQAQILRLLEDFTARGHTLLFITHDLAVVSRIADRVVVMNDGQVVEEGPTATVFATPKHEYTRSLLEAVPSSRVEASRSVAHVSREAGASLPSIEPAVVAGAYNISKRYTLPGGRSLTALDNLSFELRAGQTLGLVGESGSGKSTAGRILLGFTSPDSGYTSVAGQQWSALNRAQTTALRQHIQVIYQDPLSSFDPRHSVAQILDEAVGVVGVGRAARRPRVLELLDQVGLSHTLLQRRPLQLSGGQRQRVAIARALALEPQIIVCDEPVSALDVSIQAQVLDLLVDIQRETDVALLFISHDLGVIRYLSDEVLVLKDGETVERGEVDQIFRTPQQQYTRDLISAIPVLPGSATLTELNTTISS